MLIIIIGNNTISSCALTRLPAWGTFARWLRRAGHRIPAGDNHHHLAPRASTQLPAVFPFGGRTRQVMDRHINILRDAVFYFRRIRIRP